MSNAFHNRCQQHRNDEISKLSEAFRVVFVFIEKPLAWRCSSGGLKHVPVFTEGTTTFTSGRNGGIPQEGLRDDATDGCGQLLRERIFNKSCEHLSEEFFTLDSSDMQMGKPGTVRAMIRKFSQDDAKNPARLQRRNTLPTCTNLAALNVNFSGEISALNQNLKNKSCTKSVNFSSNTIDLISNDPFEDGDTISNERLPDVSTCDKQESFSRDSVLRKSLPSTALRVYMRNDSLESDTPVQGELSHAEKTYRKYMSISALYTIPKKIVPQAKITVFKKPEIPAILLKTKDCETTSKNDEGLEKKLRYAAEVPPNVPQEKCSEQCHLCPLVDLWMTFHKLENSQDFEIHV